MKNMYDESFYRKLMNIDPQALTRVITKIALQDDAEIAMGFAQYVGSVALAGAKNEKLALRQWLVRKQPFESEDLGALMIGKSLLNRNQGDSAMKVKMSPLEACATLLQPSDSVTMRIRKTTPVALNVAKKEFFQTISPALGLLQHECGVDTTLKNSQVFDSFATMCLAWVRDSDVHENLLKRKPALYKIKASDGINSRGDIPNRISSDQPLTGMSACVTELNPVAMRALEAHSSDRSIAGEFDSPVVQLGKAMATGKAAGFDFPMSVLVSTLLQEWTAGHTKNNDSLFNVIVDAFAHPDISGREQVVGQSNLLQALSEKLTSSCNHNEAGFFEYLTQCVFDDSKIGIYRPHALQSLSGPQTVSLFKSMIELCDYPHLHHIKDRICPDAPMNYDHLELNAYYGASRKRSVVSIESFNRTIDFLIQETSCDVHKVGAEKGMNVLHKMAEAMSHNSISIEKTMNCMRKMLEIGVDPEQRCTNRRWKPESYMPQVQRDGWTTLVRSVKAKDEAFNVLKELSLG